MSTIILHHFLPHQVNLWAVSSFCSHERFRWRNYSPKITHNRISYHFLQWAFQYILMLFTLLDKKKNRLWLLKPMIMPCIFHIRPWLCRYPPVSCHLREFLHYLHCYLIAPCSYLSVKTPFVKVRGIDFFLIWWHSCSFFTDLFSLRFAWFARITVFFDGAYRAVWVQIPVFNVHFCKSMQLRAL